MDFGRNTSSGPKDPEEYAALDTLTTESLMVERQTVLLSLRSRMQQPAEFFFVRSRSKSEPILITECYVKMYEKKIS